MKNLFSVEFVIRIIFGITNLMSRKHPGFIGKYNEFFG